MVDLSTMPLIQRQPNITSVWYPIIDAKTTLDDSERTQNHWPSYMFYISSFDDL